MTGPPNRPSLQSEHATPPNQGGVWSFGRDRMINSPNPIECLALTARLVPGIRRGTEPHELRHRTCLPRICARATTTPNQQLPRRLLELHWRGPHIARRCIVHLQRRKASSKRTSSEKCANPTDGARANRLHRPHWPRPRAPHQPYQHAG
jgi:hypothetical protein